MITAEQWSTAFACLPPEVVRRIQIDALKHAASLCNERAKIIKSITAKYPEQKWPEADEAELCGSLIVISAQALAL